MVAVRKDRLDGVGDIFGFWNYKIPLLRSYGRRQSINVFRAPSLGDVAGLLRTAFETVNQ